MTHLSLNELLRSLPSVDEILEDPQIQALLSLLPRTVLVDAIRTSIAETRALLLQQFSEENDAVTSGTNHTHSKSTIEPNISAGYIATKAGEKALAILKPSLRRVVNASGVIVHTNLGRSALADEAVEAVTNVARGYSTLEYDVANMKRGSRHDHCEKLICALTGAEAAIAVNNNAAAVMMVLSEFAAGHEAIVSRGELVEIGGSFRIPDIMAFSHATMVEVGTTNKTHEFDYERAITNNTAMLLKVHTSNYRLIGFTESVSGQALRKIADQAQASRNAAASQTQTDCNTKADRILVYEDLGSGALLPLEGAVEHIEPTVREALASGCDLVSFSGDKLLGGPQAGIIVGSKELIDRLKKNPLARVLRLDKMTLAALEATLRIYLDPTRARHDIPTLRMLDTPADVIKTYADKLQQRIAETLQAETVTSAVELEVIPEISRAGGGALPMYDIPTYNVQVKFLQGNAQKCEEYLIRENSIPVVARIRQECVLFDPRTLVSEDEMDEIAHALAAYLKGAMA